MKKKDKIELINKVINHYKQTSNEVNKINDVFKTCDFPFADCYYKLFDDYCKEISLRIGDTNDWIGWFIYENDCGTRNMEVIINKKTFKINSVQSLVDIIEN